MNVRDYFEKTFPGHTYTRQRDSEDLKSMPLDSTCGDDCKGAIDAGAKLEHHVRMAHGEHAPNFIRQIRNIVVDVCGVYICG